MKITAQPTFLALALAAGLAAMPAHAETGKTYIVQFHDSAVTAPVRAPVHDSRIDNDPQRWGYVDTRVVDRVQSVESRYNVHAQHAYSHAIKGFAAELTDSQVALLAADPSVMSIEVDQPMHASAQDIPWGIARTDATNSSTLAGNGAGTIAGVNVYVIDTGIASHPDLNLLAHYNFSTNAQNTDCNGHGTHVAGTIGARDNTVGVVGMAPGVPLTGVKVLDCSGAGTTSGVIKGIDWVTANARKPAVANMSLGGAYSSALESAVSRSVASGVVYAMAAGNSAADACTQSPAHLGGSLNGAITVGATDSNDAAATFSNYGTCVDTWAPGVGVESTWLNSGTNTLSGTSMATPHVTGAAALYLSRNLYASPAAVEAAIRQNAVATGKSAQDGRAISRLDVIRF